MLILRDLRPKMGFDASGPLERTIFGNKKSVRGKWLRILISRGLPSHIFRFVPHHPIKWLTIRRILTPTHFRPKMGFDASGPLERTVFGV